MYKRYLMLIQQRFEQVERAAIFRTRLRMCGFTDEQGDLLSAGCWGAAIRQTRPNADYVYDLYSAIESMASRGISFDEIEALVLALP